MLKNEFLNLRIGDKVVLISHGKNKGKMAIVDDIIRGPGDMGTAYLEPINCEFEFTNNNHKPNKNGLYGWNHLGIGLPKKADIHNTKDLKVYRFLVYINPEHPVRRGVVCDDEVKAYSIIYNNLIKNHVSKNVVIDLLDICEIIKGTII